MSNDYAQDLNPAQWEAVKTTEGPLLVIAGAGSGKTRTIVYRLAHLVDQEVSPNNILLLTFTRKAAGEMLERAGILLGMGGLTGVAGGTFHSFAYGMLRRFAHAAMGQERFTVMDQGDAEGIVKELKDQLKLGKGDRSFPKKRTVLEMISKSRNKEVAINDLVQREAFHLQPYADEIEQISREYADFKRKNALMDYDDLLFGLERLLLTDENVRQFAAERFKYVMVDEFQDTNLVQSRLVNLLAGPSRNVMVVGDDAQSIYAFRGANVYNILSFPENFPGTRIIRLERNYRSTQPILDLTNSILEGARVKYEKNLYTERKQGNKPRLIKTISDRSQAQAVLSTILDQEKRFPLHEIAVIFRAGYHSYALEVALNKLGLPFTKFGGIKFTEAAHIKDALAYMRLAVNAADLPSWQRVLGFVKGVGPKTVLKIHGAIMSGDEAKLAGFTKRHPEIANIFMFLDSLRQGETPPAAMLGKILEFYQPILEAAYPDDYPRRQAGLEQLSRIASDYRSVDLFLAEISLEVPDENQGRNKENTLVLSTAHSAKGLEWSAVNIIDLVEDRFPSRHALADPEDLEEERRLLYVACTRAREELNLFVPGTVYNQYANTSEPVRPSPFIAALPFSVVEEWRENYGGGLSKCADINACAPEPGQSAPEQAAQTPHPKARGYVRHKIFGRGKIIGEPSPGKYRVNFPGFGPKVILADYLEME
jgi:DNA helicase-2/ATP-dependent DNA helicase PcrA